MGRAKKAYWELCLEKKVRQRSGATTTELIPIFIGTGVELTQELRDLGLMPAGYLVGRYWMPSLGTYITCRSHHPEQHRVACLMRAELESDGWKILSQIISSTGTVYRNLSRNGVTRGIRVSDHSPRAISVGRTDIRISATDIHRARFYKKRYDKKLHMQRAHGPLARPRSYTVIRGRLDGHPLRQEITRAYKLPNPACGEASAQQCETCDDCAECEISSADIETCAICTKSFDCVNWSRTARA